jgi:hypothetical protein
MFVLIFFAFFFKAGKWCFWCGIRFRCKVYLNPTVVESQKGWRKARPYESTLSTTAVRSRECPPYVIQV